MMILAVIFPIHFFFLRQVWWGIAYWVGVPLLWILVSLLAIATFGLGAIFFVLPVIAWIIIWIVGMVQCREWTNAYNAQHGAL